MHIQFTRICLAFAVPLYFCIGGEEGSRSSYRFEGKTAFYYFLTRYHATTDKLVLLETKFGVDYSVFSKVFCTVLKYVDQRYAHLYQNLVAAVPRFPEFNARIKAKILQMRGEIPPEAARVAIFEDGTRVRVGKSVEWRIQRENYSRKYGHNAGKSFFDIFTTT